MDTLLFLRDTITANVVKVVDPCQPCIQEAETNGKDIVIIAIICGTILIISVATIIALFRLKKREYEATKTHNDNSSDSFIKKRQKAEYEDRLLSFLERNALFDTCNGDLGKTQKTMRSIDSDESQYYIEVLRALIKDDDIPKYTKYKKNNDEK